MKKSATKSALTPSNATNVLSVLKLEDGGRPASKPTPTATSTAKMKELELSVHKMKISSTLAQTTPGGDDKLENVHPAATIFRDHLLRGVVEENDKMREEIFRLKPARDLLGSLEIVTKTGKVIASASLDFSRISKSCTGCDCRASSLSILFVDFNPLPLPEVFGAEITMAGQVVASFPEESLRVDYLEDKPINAEGYFRVAFNFGRGRGFVGGFVSGASEEDIIHLKNTPEKDRQISAEQSPSFAFAPGDIQWFIGDALRGIIRAFGPTAMYDGSAPLECDGSMPRTYAFLRDWRVESIQLSSDDKALRSIVESLGGDESQMAVLHENESLKNVRFRHELAVQLLGTVEISHPQGKVKLSLRDGQLSTPRGSFWFVSVKRETECNAVLNDLGALSCTVSGIRLEDESFQLDRSGDDLVVGLTSRCGTRVVGYVDEESIGGAEPDLDELMLTLDRVFRGEKAFPSSASFRIAYVMLPLDAVRNVLSALGVEY